MKQPLELELDGNYIGIDDEVIRIRLSRENELNCVIRIYSEYVLSKSKLPFNKWLDKEMKKEVTKRLKKELGVNGG